MREESFTIKIITDNSSPADHDKRSTSEIRSSRAQRTSYRSHRSKAQPLNDSRFADNSYLHLTPKKSSRFLQEKLLTPDCLVQTVVHPSASTAPQSPPAIKINIAVNKSTSIQRSRVDMDKQTGRKDPHAKRQGRGIRSPESLMYSPSDEFTRPKASAGIPAFFTLTPRWLH
mgnify:CR=1 FL=1